MTDTNWDIDNVSVRHVYDKSGKSYLTDVLSYIVTYGDSLAFKLQGDKVLIRYKSGIVSEEHNRLLSQALESLPTDLENASTASSLLDLKIVSGAIKIPKIAAFSQALEFNQALDSYEFDKQREK